MNIRLYKILALILVLSVFTLSSCDEWIDTELNEDPDALTDVSMKSLLANSQFAFFFVMGDADMRGYSAAWTKHLRGADRQFLAVYNYNIGPGDMNNMWDSFYEDDLEGLQLLKQKAANQESPHFTGVAKVMEAASLGALTDFIGPLPYSDAFKGESGVFQAEWDSQEEIYNTINTLLTEAISDLGTPAAQNQVPLSGDIIYQGDVDKWIALAHSLRARYNMHLSERGESNYGQAISDLNNGISSLEGDFQMAWETSLAKANPMHQFVRERSGYMVDNDFFQNFIDGDPRKPKLYLGSASGPWGFWYQASSPVMFMDYPECMFLKAEAQHRDGNASGARASLKTAIEASLEKLGVEGGSWWTSKSAEIDAASGADLLELIMEQKYIHDFGNPPIAYVDFRRTGYPDELLANPNVGSEFPDRYPFPTDEIELNQNTPDWTTIYDNLWIDPNDEEKQ
jgi:hypothetical protein